MTHTRPTRLAVVTIAVTALLLAPVGIAAAQSGTVDDVDLLADVTVNDPDGDLVAATNPDNIRLNIDNEPPNEWIYNDSVGPGQAFGRAYLNFSALVQVDNFGGGSWSSATTGLSTGPNGTVYGVEWSWQNSCNVGPCGDLTAPDGSRILRSFDGSADETQRWISIEYVHATGELITRAYNSSAMTNQFHESSGTWDPSISLDELAVWDDQGGGRIDTSHSATIGNVSVEVVAETERVEIRGIPTDQVNRNETLSYEVVAVLSDGSDVTVTGTSTEQSNDTSLLTVDDAGTAQAQDAAGNVRVNASYEGLTTSINTTVYNRTLEDIRFVDGPVASIAVLLDMGIWMLLAIALFCSMGCDRIWEEEIAIMLFVAGTAAIWLLGFAGIYLPIASILVGGSMIFSPLGPPH